MKILVVHEVSYLKKVTYEFQILPEALSLLGHEVTVVDFDDTPCSSPRKPIFGLATERYDKVHRAYPDASITLRHPGTIRIPILSRISGSVAATLEIRRVLSETPFDAMLLYGVPTVGIQSVLTARRYDVPVFFRSIDVSHKLVPFRVLSPLTRLIERYVYKSADGVSALTPRLKDYVASHGVPPTRIGVLPAGVDVEMFSGGERKPSPLNEWGIDPHDPVILFMGTIYRFSGLDTVIRDFPRLLSEHPNARLVVVGHGEDQARLSKLAASTGVSRNVIFTGRQPYQLLPDIIRASDICINPFELNDITRDILPTKLFQYLACERPLVATRLPGTDPFLSGEDQGVVYSSLEEFVGELSALLNQPERRALLGQSARRAMLSRYDWKRIAQELINWMREVH